MAYIPSLIERLYHQARQMGACDIFTGRERTLDDVVSLFTSPQGMEFCLAHRWPALPTLRLFPREEAAAKGVYIDADTVNITNPGTCVLIGRTHAVVRCDTLARHRVYLLHGASAVITASGWAVVHAETAPGCNIVKRASGHAIIL